MPKTSSINMRVEPHQKSLIEKAAELLNMDRVTFIMNAACRDAENALLDRRLFVLDNAEFTTFLEALDRPLPNRKRLQELLAEPSPWD